MNPSPFLRKSSTGRRLVESVGWRKFRVNCQGARLAPSFEKNLRSALKEAMEFNRDDALAAARWKVNAGQGVTSWTSWIISFNAIRVARDELHAIGLGMSARSGSPGRGTRFSVFRPVLFQSVQIDGKRFCGWNRR